MKLKFLLSLFCLFIAGQLHAQCDQNFCCVANPCAQTYKCAYISAFGGANWLEQCKHHDIIHLKHKPGAFVGGALGYRFNPYLRMEAEIAYRSNDVDSAEFEGSTYYPDSHVETYSYMANGYFDFACVPYVTPYVGAGAGYGNCKAITHFCGERGRATTSGFAAQLMAGASVAVCDNTDVAIEYRCFIGHENFRNHDALLSVKCFF